MNPAGANLVRRRLVLAIGLVALFGTVAYVAQRQDPGEDARRDSRGASRAQAGVPEGVARGPAAPGIDRAVALAAVGALAPAVETCIASRGGDAALSRALRDELGETPRRLALFELGPDGRTIPSSIRIDPPLDPAFDECFRAPLLGLTLERVGREGANLAVPLLALRQGRPRPADAGRPDAR